MVAPFSELARELERRIRARTGRRIRNLTIELLPECVILRGQTESFYLKQLAQHSVREVLPQVRLTNAISVERLETALAPEPADTVVQTASPSPAPLPTGAGV